MSELKQRDKKIVILGDYNPQYYTHLAVDKVVRHLSKTVHNNVTFEWRDTDKFEIESDFNTKYSGLWLASGSPYKDMQNVLSAVQFARENNIPAFGNCGGFQHMLIEYARNVCGISNADTEETNPGGHELVISKLSCSLVGEQELITVKESSQLFSLIGKNQLIGKYHCNYSLNPFFTSLLESYGMKMTATNTEGEIRAFEVPTHPFYLGTLFQPALTSTEDVLSPILLGFVQTVGSVRA